MLGARLGVPKMTYSDLADLDDLHARMRWGRTPPERAWRAIQERGAQ